LYKISGIDVSVFSLIFLKILLNALQSFNLYFHSITSQEADAQSTVSTLIFGYAQAHSTDFE
jgi:hypothetical protein